MNKIHEIVTAWANFARPTEKQLNKANERYSVCKPCEYNSGGPVEVCKKCICPLQIKIFTNKTPEEGNCPENKWKE